MTPWEGLTRALAVLLLASCPAAATERFDHRGALGLLLGGGFELGELVRSGRFEEYSRGIGSLGVSASIGDNGNELIVQVAKPDSLEWAAIAGYRGYFGQDRTKTFFDLDLALDLRPAFTAGPRVGFGVQYELNSAVGLFAGLAARVGIGSPTRFATEIFAGIQLRSYLLE